MLVACAAVVARDVRAAPPDVGGAGAAGAARSRWPSRSRGAPGSAPASGSALLFLLRDFRLLALLPVALGAFLIVAPADLTARLYSTFSLTDPSNVDRVAMMRSGLRIIKDDPLTGVGPDMIIQVYPHYRDKSAGQPAEPAPAQRAAADCRRARPAGAGRLALVHRHAGPRLSASAGPASSVAVERRPRGDRRRCSRPGCSNTISATPSS